MTCEAHPCEDLKYARQALAAVRKAKDENDERFILERDQAREDCARAEKALAELRTELAEARAALADAREEVARLTWECGKLTARSRL